MFGSAAVFAIPGLAWRAGMGGAIVSGSVWGAAGWVTGTGLLVVWRTRRR